MEDALAVAGVLAPVLDAEQGHVHVSLQVVAARLEERRAVLVTAALTWELDII